MRTYDELLADHPAESLDRLIHLGEMAQLMEKDARAETFVRDVVVGIVPKCPQWVLRSLCQCLISCRLVELREEKKETKHVRK